MYRSELLRASLSVKRFVKSELTGGYAPTMTTALQPRSYASNFHPAMRSFLSYPVVKLALGARVSRSAAKLYGGPSERRDDCHPGVVGIGKHVREQFGGSAYSSLDCLDMDWLARAGNNAKVAETSADNPRL